MLLEKLDSELILDNKIKKYNVSSNELKIK